MYWLHVQLYCKTGTADTRCALDTRVRKHHSAVHVIYYDVIHIYVCICVYFVRSAAMRFTRVRFGCLRSLARNLPRPSAAQFDDLFKLLIDGCGGRTKLAAKHTARIDGSRADETLREIPRVCFLLLLFSFFRPYRYKFIYIYTPTHI